MKKLLTIIAIIAFILPLSLKAQNEEEQKPENGNDTYFFLVPQYAIINGFRLDVERSFDQGNKALVFSPHFYVRNGDDNDFRTTDFNSLIGAGLNADYKYYLSDRQISYISVGAGYHYFNSKHNGSAWVETNGDEIMHETGEYSQIVNRVNVNALLGFKVEITDRIYTDLYTGMGLKYAMIDSQLSQTYFDEYMWQHAYSGVTYLVGIKVGVKL